MKKAKSPTVPAKKLETARESIRGELGAQPVSAREIGARIGLREKDVVEHLAHIAAGAKARGERLRIEPAVCEKCGFVFDERERVTRPSKCPECKGERISAPLFSVEPRD